LREEAIRFQAQHARDRADGTAARAQHRDGDDHQGILADQAQQGLGHHGLVGPHDLLEIGPVGDVGQLGADPSAFNAGQGPAIGPCRQHAVEQGVQGRLLHQEPGHRRAVVPEFGPGLPRHGNEAVLQRFQLAGQQ
jgi:hypothetical protein